MSMDEYRRFLITIGIGTYHDPAISNLPEAPTDALRVRDLLTPDPHAYEIVLPELSTLPAREVPGVIEQWTAEQDLGERDVVVVYFAGHGAKGPDRHYLYWHDTIPARWTTSVATEDLVRPLMHSPVGHLLLVLDACYAAAGGGEVAVLASDLVTTHRDAAGRWTLSSARPKQTAREAAFVDALAHTLTHPRTGARQEFLSVREVAECVNLYFTERGEPQRATHTTVDSDGRTPFFPNPLHVKGLPAGDLDVATLAVLRKRHRGHFEPRGLGVEHAADRGDYFTARTAALRELATWLGSDTHDRHARVITGRPGSGKSSLLGRLLLLADPDHPARHRTAPGLLPPAGMDIVPLHARRASCESLTRDLGAALGLADATIDDVLRALAERITPVTVIVDALDEAGTAGDSVEGTRIGRDLLRHLTSLPKIRLIIGTRDPLIKTLGRAITVIDLDTPEYVTHADIADYARDVLLDSHDPDSLSPYRNNPGLAVEVGDAIATRAGTLFLVARMTARALVHDHHAVDTTQAGWRDRLPRDAIETFAAYLQRFGPDRPKVERLLRPLAYAQGAGLPWSSLWHRLAQALSGIPCPYEDVRWLHEHAGAYIVENLVDGESVFRLFHETMAEHLRTPNQTTYAHHGITAALLDHVATDSATGRRDWEGANRYIRYHLATHAAAGHQLDTLIADTDYLVHANPDELLVALDKISTDHGRLTRSIYRTSAQVHRRLPIPQRRQVLATDAARFGATRQHQLLSKPLQWSTRWATGQMTNSALRSVLTGHTSAVVSVVCAEVDGRSVAVTTSWDDVARVWDLTTGTLQHTLTGHTDAVVVVAYAEINARPVAITTSNDNTARV